MLSSNIPQIRISLTSGEALDPGLKKEISQQVREFRAQKLSQRGRSPGQVQNQSQAAGQGHGAAKSQTEAVSQSNKAGNLSAASQQRDKPRDRPLSAHSQAAQLKAVQPRPLSPRQGPSPRSGPEPASTPVSTRPRSKSHSPCCRIDVDVDWPPAGRQWGLSSSHQNIFAAAAASPTTVDPLSWSFPDMALQSALSSRSLSGSFLQVHDDRHFLPIRGGDEGAGRSRSACDLSASAPASVFRWSLAEAAPTRSLSSQHLGRPAWGCPPSPGSQSPQRSASPWQLGYGQSHLLSPERAACGLHVSPTHSPLGSQSLIF